MRVLNNVFKYLSSVTEVNDEKDDDYPKDFDCPICMSKMVDPVICEDGHSYDRFCITKWLDVGRTISPKTNLPLSSKALITNHQLRAAIEPFLNASDLQRREDHKKQIKIHSFRKYASIYQHKINRFQAFIHSYDRSLDVIDLYIQDDNKLKLMLENLDIVETLCREAKIDIRVLLSLSVNALTNALSNSKKYIGLIRYAGFELKTLVAMPQSDWVFHKSDEIVAITSKLGISWSDFSKLGKFEFIRNNLSICKDLIVNCDFGAADLVQADDQKFRIICIGYKTIYKFISSVGISWSAFIAVDLSFLDEIASNIYGLTYAAHIKHLSWAAFTQMNSTERQRLMQRFEPIFICDKSGMKYVCYNDWSTPTVGLDIYKKMEVGLGHDRTSINLTFNRRLINFRDIIDRPFDYNLQMDCESKAAPFAIRCRDKYISVSAIVPPGINPFSEISGSYKGKIYYFLNPGYAQYYLELHNCKDWSIVDLELDVSECNSEDPYTRQGFNGMSTCQTEPYVFTTPKMGVTYVRFFSYALASYSSEKLSGYQFVAALEEKRAPIDFARFVKQILAESKEELKNSDVMLNKKQLTR